MTIYDIRVAFGAPSTFHGKQERVCRGVFRCDRFQTGVMKCVLRDIRIYQNMTRCGNCLKTYATQCHYSAIESVFSAKQIKHLAGELGCFDGSSIRAEWSMGMGSTSQWHRPFACTKWERKCVWYSVKVAVLRYLLGWWNDWVSKLQQAFWTSLDQYTEKAWIRSLSCAMGFNSPWMR